MKSISIVLFLFSIATSIATGAANAQTPGGKMSKTDIKATLGCITGSIGRLKNGVYDNRRMDFTLLIQGDEGVAASIPFYYDKPGSRRNDVNDVRAFGKTFTVCLRPGQYEISHLEVRVGYPLRYLRGPFRIPILVEQQKNIYIGSFMLDNSSLASACRGTPGAPYIRLENQAGRDLPLIMKGKSPPQNVPVIDIVTPEAFNPLIVRCDS